MKHSLVLPDGSRVSSGSSQEPALTKLRLTRSVNEGTELTPGSVCAATLEAEILGLPQPPVETFDLYEGETLLGRFRDASWTALGHGLWQLTATDPVAALDRDLTAWLNQKADFPRSLLTFAREVCEACGVTLANETLTNGDFPVGRFTATSVTGRQLMAWVGELSGCFCRADAGGRLVLGWYARRYAPVLTPGPYAVPGAETAATYQAGHLALTGQLRLAADDGDGNLTVTLDGGGRTGHPGYLGTCRILEEAVAPIDWVKLRLNARQPGVCYPETGSNLYLVTGNYLLAGASAEALSAAARTLYRKLCRFSYTPCQITVAPGSGILPGDILELRDDQGRVRQTCVQKMTREGGRETLLSRGSPRRSDRAVKNSTTFQGVQGQLTELEMSMTGLTTRVEDTEEGYSQLKQTAEGLTTRVEDTEEGYSQLKQTAQSLTTRVEDTEEGYSQLKQTAQSLTTRVEDAETGYSQLKQTAEGLTTRVQDTEDNYATLSQQATGLTVRVAAAEDRNAALSGTVSGLTAALGEKATEQAVTEVRQTAEGISIAVSGLREVADAKADRTELQRVTERFVFDEDGLTIRNSATGMGIGISEEQVAFTGGTTLIRPGDMQTTNLRVGTRLDLGDFTFFPRTNGNLSFRYTGPTG